MIDTDAGRLRLDWDAAGRLREIRQGETSERFIYDAQGRRVAKRIGNQIRYFAWDGNKVRIIYDRLRKDRKCGDEPALNCPPRKN